MKSMLWISLTLLISAVAQQATCSQSHSKVAPAPSTENSKINTSAALQQERKRILSDCLSELPLDLVSIIAEYEPYSLEGIHHKSLSGHTDMIRSLIALPENECASGSNDHTIKIWNSRTGQCKQTLEEPRFSVYLLIPMADGRIASFDTGGYLVFWKKDVEGRWLLEHVRRIVSMVRSSISITPHTLVCGLQNGSIEFWQENQEKRQWESAPRIAVHTQPVLALAALSDGRLVSKAADKLTVLTTSPNTTLVTPLEEAAEPAHAPLTDSSCFTLAILPGNTIISGSASGISIYQETDKKLSCFKRLVNMCWPRAASLGKEWSQQQTIPSPSLCSLAALPDQRFAAKALSGLIMIYSYNKKSKHWGLDQTIANHASQQTQQPSCPTLVTLKDGKLATTTRSNSENGQETIEIWS